MGRDDVLSVLTARRSDQEGLGVQSLRLFSSVAKTTVRLLEAAP
jgi:hypothetical protein